MVGNITHHQQIFQCMFYPPTKRRRDKCMGELVELEQFISFRDTMSFSVPVLVIRWMRIVNHCLFICYILISLF
jgi:hypothetical protein